MTAFSYETTIPVRFRDLDAMGHVNNSVYATYLEEARRHYFADVLDLRLESVDTVLAHLSIDYRTPLDGDRDATVAMRVPELGSSSIPMECEIRAGDTVAATAETVQVTFDPESGGSRPLPDEWRERIASFEGLDG